MVENGVSAGMLDHEAPPGYFSYRIEVDHNIQDVHSPTAGLFSQAMIKLNAAARSHDESGTTSLLLNSKKILDPGELQEELEGLKILNILRDGQPVGFTSDTS